MNYKMNKKYVCEICNIRTRRVENSKRTFMAKFPLDVDRCKQWVKVIGKEDLVYVPIQKLHQLKYVCGEHFKPTDLKKKRTQLKKNAVPSLGISTQPLTDEMLSGFPLHVSTSNSTIEPSSKLTRMDVTPRKRKLQQKLKKSKAIIKNLLKRVAHINSIKSPALKNLINSTVRNQNRKPQGRRWTTSDKSLALAIYKKSPKGYRQINQLVPMPSVRTLQTILQNTKMDPGVYPSVMAHLHKAGQKMTEKDRICVLMFDEIALKKRLILNVTSDKIDGYVDTAGEDGRTQEFADHALVFMLQGIRKKFKQPIAHYFVKGTISTQKLAVIIKEVIRVVRAAGYTVISTVCDQGPTNVGALNLLKQFCGYSNEINYFFVDTERVYIIYDVPHLFKSIRNNFMQAGILTMNNKKANWSHLVQLERKNKSTLHFKKNSKLHVDPKFRSKMKVKLAAQVLSNTVAAVLKLLAESVNHFENSTEILETAEIIQDLDRLFDCTNGPSSAKDIKKNIRENVKKSSFRHRLWIEYKQKLKTLNFLKSDSRLRLKNVRCVNGYIITLSSLQDIWKYVECKNFKYLNLRQLNQDSIENLFGIIRQHSPTNRNPTCHHFESALKSSVLTRLSTITSRGSNCESDSNEILFDFHDIVFGEKESKQVSKQLNINENEIPSTSSHNHMSILSANEDLPVLHIGEEYEEMESDKQLEELLKKFDKQPTVYVSGYLAKAILKNQRCALCHDAIKVTDPKSNPIYNYIAFREWWNDKSSLTYPSIKLCQTVDIATKVFEREVRTLLFIKNITRHCITAMMIQCDMTWMCGVHRVEMSELLLHRLSYLLIRNECHIINQSFALTEEASADSLKKAQQQAIAK